MALKFLQSLVQRGAVTRVALVTGTDGKGDQVNGVPSANRSFLRYPRAGSMPLPAHAARERLEACATATAVQGAGRSLRPAGVPGSTRVARLATRAIRSVWPTFSTAPSAYPNTAPAASRNGRRWLPAESR